MENVNFKQLIIDGLEKALNENFDIYQHFILRSTDRNFRPDIFIQNPSQNTSLAIEVKAFSEDVELPRAMISELIAYKISLDKIGTDLILVSTSNIPVRVLEELEKNKIKVIISSNIEEIVSIIVHDVQKDQPPPSRKIGRVVKFTNSRGKTYYLHGRMTNLIGGGERMIYFFSGDIKEGALESLPEGFSITETKSGLPVLKKT